MDYYSIQESTISVESLVYTVELNADHPVFAGHFPGQPVVPGVLLLRMVRELLSHGASKAYRLKAANSVKFLKAVDPNVVTTLKVSIDIKPDQDGCTDVRANATFGEDIYFKLRARFE